RHLSPPHCIPASSTPSLALSLFFLYSYAPHRHLHSFPTRRSSDLHLDRYGGPLADFYEDRLQIAEAYDRAGFHAYHLAEHHSTPLGMAPSPSVFLAAVAQRTRRLRFGPLVWAMPLHHPLPLIEDICMLDPLNSGRL